MVGPIAGAKVAVTEKPASPSACFDGGSIGAQISSDLRNNAAGIRDSGTPGASYSLAGVEITGNQDGILSNAGNWTLSNFTVHANGAGDGLTHELYFNDDNASNVVRLTNCTVTQVTGCEFQAPQKCLRLISVYAINFMP
jgi:hypothetical protein